MTPTEFIDKWKWVAIWQHVRYGIPASITLAQAILESNYGNSKLAIQANNYFGIKAYSNPDNRAIYYATDDLTNEPFRAYNNPKDSFTDHSIFLIENPRYKNLFTAKDSTQWATGLKQAGYATSPTYDKQLITLIDTYDLERFDVYGNNVVSFSLLLATVIGLIIYLILNRNKK